MWEAGISDLRKSDNFSWGNLPVKTRSLVKTKPSGNAHPNNTGVNRKLN